MVGPWRPVRGRLRVPKFLNHPSLHLVRGGGDLALFGRVYRDAHVGTAAKHHRRHRRFVDPAIPINIGIGHPGRSNVAEHWRQRSTQVALRDGAVRCGPTAGREGFSPCGGSRNAGRSQNQPADEQLRTWGCALPMPRRSWAQARASTTSPTASSNSSAAVSLKKCTRYLGLRISQVSMPGLIPVAPMQASNQVEGLDHEKRVSAVAYQLSFSAEHIGVVRGVDASQRHGRCKR